MFVFHVFGHIKRVQVYLICLVAHLSTTYSFMHKAAVWYKYVHPCILLGWVE